VKKLEEKIEELVLPILAAIDAFLIDIQIVINAKRDNIQVTIDTDKGITVDQCAAVSRELGTAIDLQNVIQGSYVLQVSSPGLEKPLRLLRQYQKNLGREFTVRFREDSAIREICGKLAAIDGERLTFLLGDKETIDVQFREIIETREQLPW
jgi:ribosome maturation factor RimP